MKRFIGGALGAAVVTAIAIGCGGSSDSTVGGSGNDSGAGTPPPPPPGPNNPPAPPPPPPPPPPADSGPDTNIDAPTVNIDYMANCPAFTPCNVDPKGTWKLSGGCIDSSIFAAAKQNCAGLQESKVVITAKGVTTIAATTVTQKSHSDFSATLLVPTACTAGQSCATIGAFLMTPQGGSFDTATCASVTAGCSCDVTKATTTSTSDTYTFTAGVLTTGGGEKFDLCVKPANTLTSRQQDPGGGPGPATFTSTK